MATAENEREKMARALDEDNPRGAGQMCGPYLERRLREYAYSFGVLLPYHPRNEHTLGLLAERLLTRLKDKLGGAHPATVAAVAVEADLGLRNLTAHWKDPDIEITTDEMRLVLKKGDELLAHVHCTEKKCSGTPRYDGAGTFVSSCGAVRLTKQKAS
jgi:hypothetical protein